MKNVIGIDFGNTMAYTCFANGMDMETRFGGTIESLIPAQYNVNGEGIPNEFFWGEIRTGAKSYELGELYGVSAVKQTNRPIGNRVKCVKRHLGEKITLKAGKDPVQTKEFKYDDIIIKLFEYHIKMANDALREKHGKNAETNLVSVAIPAKFRFSNYRNYYKDLIEKADSGVLDENGNMLKAKVVGLVCEPAAAGLGKLSELALDDVPEEVSYCVFDWGGGTFDIAIVTLYPFGKEILGKKVYYQEVCEGRGISVGGSDFTEKIQKYMKKQITDKLGEEIANSPKTLKEIYEDAETIKRDLSKDSDEYKRLDAEGNVEYWTSYSIGVGEDDVFFEITRKDFENIIKDDVDTIMEFTQSFFREHSHHLPDEIIMTGGTCHIPYVKERLMEALPDYKDKISLYRPSTAAAYGAARFFNGSDGTPVLKKLEYDLGTRMIDKDGVLKIRTLLKADTQLPCESEVARFSTTRQGKTTNYDIYKAIVPNPEETNIHDDYDLFFEANLDYGRLVPENTGTSCKLSIDEMGIIHLEAWENDNQSIRVEVEHKLNNTEDDYSSYI